MQGRFAGSPYHQGFDYPNGNLCHYKWEFNDDDKFLGATIVQQDSSARQRSGRRRQPATRADWPTRFLRALGVPWLNRRYVAVYVNGNRRGTLMEDAQMPDSDMVKEHLPNDPDGLLYKMQPWFEFAPVPSGDAIPFNNNSWCNLNAYTTTGGVKKMARYRYNFEIRRTPDSASDFTNVFSLVDAANTSGSPNYRGQHGKHGGHGKLDARVCGQPRGGQLGFLRRAKRPEPLRLHRHAGHEVFAVDVGLQHRPSATAARGGRARICSPSMAADQGMVEHLQQPRRSCACIGARCAELVNGPLNVANSGPLIMAKYNAFAANGLSVENPGVEHRAVAVAGAKQHRVATGGGERRQLLGQPERDGQQQRGVL